MFQRSFLFLFQFGFILSQTLTDKPIETCGHALSAAKWLSTQSSLTENQEKIDITYYRINFEIDIGAQEISGSVLINGSVGLDQPDSIELDFADQMTVDSVKFSNELWTFNHENYRLKLPAPDATPEGYEFLSLIHI